jgi:adenylate kinase family enzyme
MRAGKTTIARQLAQTLQFPAVHLDRIKAEYYAAMGYDSDHAKALHFAVRQNDPTAQPKFCCA